MPQCPVKEKQVRDRHPRYIGNQDPRQKQDDHAVFVFLSSFPPHMSVTRDEAAHKLLSTVDKSPDMIMNRNGSTTTQGTSHESVKIDNSKIFRLISNPSSGKPEDPH